MNTLTVNRVVGPNFKPAAKSVIQDERIDFIAAMYREDFPLFHFNLLTRLRRITDCYPGRAWDHYRLYNGGTYMAPSYAQPTSIVVDGCDTGIVLSGDALGICTCMINLDEMAKQEKFLWMGEMFNKLHDYIWEHPEKTSIQDAVLAYRMRYILDHPA